MRIKNTSHPHQTNDLHLQINIFPIKINDPLFFFPRFIAVAADCNGHYLRVICYNKKKRMKIRIELRLFYYFHFLTLACKYLVKLKYFTRRFEFAY